MFADLLLRRSKCGEHHAMRHADQYIVRGYGIFQRRGQCFSVSLLAGLHSEVDDGFEQSLYLGRGDSPVHGPRRAA